MIKLTPITVGGDERLILEAAETVVRGILNRYHAANPERNKQLDLKMEAKPDYMGVFHIWWSVRPGSEYGQSGYMKSLPAALTEMFNHTAPELKRKSAERYREQAARLEAEAQALEKLAEVES
jgi:hypothetical protein